MAKSDNNNTFGDFSKKVKLDPTRQNLKPVDPKLTFDQYLRIAIREGNELLDAEKKNSTKTPSVTKPSLTLENALAALSTNPYIKARAEILKELSPLTRTAIEQMEKNEIPKDARWNSFCQAVQVRGDKISSKN